MSHKACWGVLGEGVLLLLSLLSKETEGVLGGIAWKRCIGVVGSWVERGCKNACM